MVSRARKQGFSLTLHDVLQSRSLAELAEAAGSSVAATQHEEKTGECFGLSPIQVLFFRSSNANKDTARFNQGMTLRVTRKVDPDVVKRAVEAVVSQHSMLRVRFSISQTGEWQQSLTDVREISIGHFQIIELTFRRRISTHLTDSAFTLFAMNMKQFQRSAKARDAWIFDMARFLPQTSSTFEGAIRSCSLWPATYASTWYPGA